MLSLLYLWVKAQQSFVSSSCMFWAKKTLFKIWLNPGLNLTTFRGTGPRHLFNCDYIRLCIPRIEAQRPAFSLSPPVSIFCSLARFSHLVKNRQKWFLHVLSTKVPSWSSVMLSILRKALHFVSKELRAFGESSVATKWRKHAIAGIMCV